MEGKKVFYPRRLPFDELPDEKYDAERKEFFDMLKKIQDEAVSTKCEYGDFYDYRYYVMKDGTTYEYVEDATYMIPYSIEKITSGKKSA